MAAAPYPADTRAKGWRFELDYERIAQSDTWALAGAEARPWLLMMWLTAWQQVPCGALSADEDVIAAKLGMPPDLWARHRATLLRGWVQADDGRLYHATVSARVLEMLDYRAKGAKRVADYKARMRDQRSGNALPPSEPPGSNDTGTGTGSKPMPVDLQDAHRAGAGERTGEGEYDPADHPPPPIFAASKAGEIGVAMRNAGVPPDRINLSDPRVAALIEQGATAAEFQGLAEEAVRKNIGEPWAWVLTVLPKRRQAAAELVLPGAPAQVAGPTVTHNPEAAKTAEYLAAERERAAAPETPEQRERARALLAQARQAFASKGIAA